MKNKAKHLQGIGWSIGIIVVTATLFHAFSEKQDLVKNYLSQSVTLRESCTYAHMQNGVNQRPINNPFKGR